MEMTLAEEARVVVKAVEAGELSAVAPEKSERWHAEADLVVSNGWVFRVFFDGYEWDYIDRVTAPDGRSLDYGDVDTSDDAPEARLMNHRPEDAALARWGIV